MQSLKGKNLRMVTLQINSFSIGDEKLNRSLLCRVYCTIYSLKLGSVCIFRKTISMETVFGVTVGTFLKQNSYCSQKARISSGVLRATSLQSGDPHASLYHRSASPLTECNYITGSSFYTRLRVLQYRIADDNDGYEQDVSGDGIRRKTSRRM